jgi:hypothetical protein
MKLSREINDNQILLFPKPKNFLKSFPGKHAHTAIPMFWKKKTQNLKESYYQAI